MRLKLTCPCERTNSVDVTVSDFTNPLEETLTVARWRCPSCWGYHAWRVPSGADVYILQRFSRRFHATGEVGVREAEYSTRAREECDDDTRLAINLGFYLFERRFKLGRTQHQVARAAGISEKQWRRYEMGDQLLKSDGDVDYKRLETLIRAVEGDMQRAFAILKTSQPSGYIPLTKRLKLVTEEKDMVREALSSYLTDPNSDVCIASLALLKSLFLRPAREDFVYWADYIHQEFYRAILGGVTQVAPFEQELFMALNRIKEAVRLKELGPSTLARVVNIIAVEGKSIWEPAELKRVTLELFINAYDLWRLDRELTLEFA